MYKSKFINHFYLLILLFLVQFTHGYIVYCPCMGRFGNQAEQLLGSLYFAKSINRTLVIPPFILYGRGNSEPTFLQPSKIIDINYLEEYHSIITLDSFLNDYAPAIWEKKYIFCFTGRGTSDCNPFDGSPFGPFWKKAVGINYFDSSILHSPLMTHVSQSKEWIIKYPQSKFPVIAFVGAPSSFPVNTDALPVHKHIRLSHAAIEKGYSFRKNIINEPYIGVHVRHGSDWERACQLLIERPLGTLFSSAQCSKGKHVTIPYISCIQTVQVIANEIKSAIEKTGIKTIYIASDKDDITIWTQVYDEIVSSYPDGVTLVTPTSIFPKGRTSKHKQPDIIEDLFILTDADFFIGNCISSFTAFVARTRANYIDKPSSYFALEQLLTYDSRIRDEL